MWVDIRLFLWTHPWWHATAVLAPPIVISAFFSWRELRHSKERNQSLHRIAELQVNLENLSYLKDIAAAARPTTQGELNREKLETHLRRGTPIRLMHNSTANRPHHPWAVGAKIENTDERGITIFTPAGQSSALAYIDYVLYADIKIVDATAQGFGEIVVITIHKTTCECGSASTLEEAMTNPQKKMLSPSFLSPL
jgi:hypothetical protein